MGEWNIPSPAASRSFLHFSCSLLLQPLCNLFNLGIEETVPDEFPFLGLYLLYSTWIRVTRRFLPLKTCNLLQARVRILFHLFLCPVFHLNDKRHCWQNVEIQDKYMGKGIVIHTLATVMASSSLTPCSFSSSTRQANIRAGGGLKPQNLLQQKPII